MIEGEKFMMLIADTLFGGLVRPAASSMTHSRLWHANLQACYATMSGVQLNAADG